MLSKLRHQGWKRRNGIIKEKMITPERLTSWRIFPRLLITLYGFAFYRTTEWFMALPDPTNAQSAFVSVIVGAGAAWFGLYVGGTRQPKPESKE